MSISKTLNQFLKSNQKVTIDKYDKKCIYCYKIVNTTNNGICSRKSCIRSRQNYNTIDKHGKYLQSIINYNERTIELKNARIL